MGSIRGIRCHAILSEAARYRLLALHQRFGKHVILRLRDVSILHEHEEILNGRSVALLREKLVQVVHQFCSEIQG